MLCWSLGIFKLTSWNFGDAVQLSRASDSPTKVLRLFSRIKSRHELFSEVNITRRKVDVLENHDPNLEWQN